MTITEAAQAGFPPLKNRDRGGFFYGEHPKTGRTSFLNAARRES